MDLPKLVIDRQSGWSTVLYRQKTVRGRLPTDVVILLGSDRVYRSVSNMGKPKTMLCFISYRDQCFLVPCSRGLSMWVSRSDDDDGDIC